MGTTAISKTTQSTQSYQTSSHSRETTMSAYGLFIEKLKFSHFGIISMTILIGSIVGGVTAMFIFKNDAAIWQLGLCMAVSMANLVAAISQAPTKWVVNLFIACMAVNTLLILVNIL
jgi:hypothetical protein